uniref:Sialate O-acetylesterase domain-containing protein n=1 Tax=Alexandrium monilatum TaxID=311494 RepID=A0A7S4T1N3_9DINO
MSRALALPAGRPDAGAGGGRLRRPSGLRPLLLLGLGALELPRGCRARQPRLSNVFQSHMVLQRGRPIEVWGFYAKHGETLDVMLNYEVSLGGQVGWAEAVVGEDGTWRANLGTPPPHVVGKQLRLALTRRGDEEPAQVLEDIVLGDVYLFSGQSNVDLPVSYVHQFNYQGEVEEEHFAEEMGQSGRLRLMIVPSHCGLRYHDGVLSSEFLNVQECRPCPPPFTKDKVLLADVNSCNLLGGHTDVYGYCTCDSLRWTRPSGALVRGFSAVAWFFGKALLETHVADGVPIGLVRSSWGATNIVVWSGPDALAKCPQEGQVPTSFAPYVKSSLWGHMIHPLRGVQFSAVIWVHGARNVGGLTPYMGGTYYACALQALIQDWRDKLEQLNLPFLIVEIPVYCNELDYRTWHTWCDDRASKLKFPDEHLPEMRIAQNQAESLPNVYVVSVMDEGSLKKAMGGAIHSERKPELGRRLALAARAAVYRDADVVWSGPTATFAWESDRNEVSVCFDTRGGGSLFLNESAICPSVVLPVYCTGATFELLSSGAWNTPVLVTVSGATAVLKVPPEVGRIERVRYAWSDWPICSVLSEAGMPARIFNIPVHREEAELMAFCPEDGSGAAGSRPSKAKSTTMDGAAVRGAWTTTTTTTAAPPLRDRGALHVIAILGTVIVSLPMLAIVVLAAQWQFAEHHMTGKPMKFHLLDQCNTDTSSEATDFQAPPSGQSSSYTSDTQAPTGQKHKNQVRSRPPSPRVAPLGQKTKVQVGGLVATRGISREVQGQRAASPGSRGGPPDSSRSSAKREGTSHAEEDPLLKHKKESPKSWLRFVKCSGDMPADK